MSEELDRLEAHPYVVRLLRSLAEHPPRVATIEEPVRRAAILLALRSRADGEPELLMIKRAEAAGDPWSGHIACPGGRMEPGDGDLAVTAVRETWEETGIDLARDGRLLGHLDDLVPRTPTLPPMVIRPYVALVSASVEIVESPEVAAAFWVPLSALCERGAWGMGLVSVGGAERRVSVFQHGEYTVWGLTERALRQMLEYMGVEPSSGV
ncbi:MAG TPA: CoA pyrophosphatase [Gemmatimonadaceae bacterium]|nr:CoA pyrophosphatase [Gemmatimonadaceae bacterium]